MPPYIAMSLVIPGLNFSARLIATWLPALLSR